MSRDSAWCSTYLDGLFENEIVGVVVLKGGVVAAGNRCFALMLGRGEGRDVEGTPLADLVVPGESRDAVESLVRSGPDAAGRSGEFFLAGDGAAPVACRFHCVRQPPSQPDPAVLVLLLLDVSDHYRLAEEYHKSMLDLEEAKLVQEENANVLSDALVQLELAEQARREKEKLQGIVELAVAAAHELSQPLQALQNELFYLQGAVPEGGEEAAALEAMGEALADLEKIVTRFRTVTSYKTTEYAKGIAMLDLGAAAPDVRGAGKDPGRND